MVRKVPTLLALAALGLAAVVQPVSAQSLREGYSNDPSKIVTYTRIDSSDVDASSAAGARTLLQRIEIAADAVCGGEARATTSSDLANYRDCRDAAVSGAVSRMRSPELAQLASRRKGELLAQR